MALNTSHMNSINEFKYSINGNFHLLVMYVFEASAAEDYQLATGSLYDLLFIINLLNFLLKMKLIHILICQGQDQGYKYEDVNKDGEINLENIRINETNTPEIAALIQHLIINFDCQCYFKVTNANVYLCSYLL